MGDIPGMSFNFSINFKDEVTMCNNFQDTMIFQ